MDVFTECLLTNSVILSFPEILIIRLFGVGSTSLRKMGEGIHRCPMYGELDIDVYLLLYSCIYIRLCNVIMLVWTLESE